MTSEQKMEEFGENVVGSGSRKNKREKLVRGNCGGGEM